MPRPRRGGRASDEVRRPLEGVFPSKLTPAASGNEAADIEKRYADAMALGLLKGHYGSNNSGEYWCEGTQFWFWSNFEYKDGDRKVYSPAELRSYDPGLYELLGRVYPTSHHIPMDPFWNHKERYKPAEKAAERKKIPN